jgi:iron complex transport system ATP-binding protein
MNKSENKKIFDFKKFNAGYSDTNILQNINLAINQNEFIAILGPNGSGKTSLINSIFGICKTTAGDIFFKNENIKNLSKDYLARNIGAVPQTVNLTYNFLVKDFIDLGIVALKKNCYSEKNSSDILHIPKDSVIKIIDELDINHLLNKKIMELSSGEFQRVLIAQSLVKNPKIIFLDEPLAHLDFKYQLEILDILKRLNQNGMTVVVIIHDFFMAFKFFNRLIFFKNGKIFEDILKNDLLADSGKKNYKKIIEEVYEINGGIFDEFFQSQNIF